MFVKDGFLNRRGAVLDIQGILGNEKHLFSFMFMRYQAATATLCFLFENRQNKTPFLPAELWEEIKSLIYSESNVGSRLPREGDRGYNASQHIFYDEAAQEKKRENNDEPQYGGGKNIPSWREND